MKQKITRFAVLPDERRLMLGIDRGELFEAGYVYQAWGFDGEVVFRKIGKYALQNRAGYPSGASTANEIIQSGIHLATEEELKAIYERDNK